jgi:electron-transferring-flavoprotein dehydrogenase
MTQPKEYFTPIEYPAPDGVLTFDLLTNLQRSGTYHAEDQPSHLRIKPNLSDIPKNISMQTYGAPEIRFCPAGVYEYVENEKAADGEPDQKLVINAQVRFCVRHRYCMIRFCCSLMLLILFIELYPLQVLQYQDATRIH